MTCLCAALILYACFTAQALADRVADHAQDHSAITHAEQELLPFTVAGEIVDERGTPVPGITVTVLVHGGEAVTDDLGRYLIDTRIPLNADSIAIVASLPDDRTGQRVTTHTATIEHDDPFLDAGILTMHSDVCGPEWTDGFGLTSTGDTIHALTVFDDGSGGGPALYAGGAFVTAGGITANRIARWDGSTWSRLGSGMNNIVYALAVFDDGSGGGPALYAGGSFSTAGDIPAKRIARWDGTSWSSLGSGMNNTVAALTVFDDGSGNGPALYAGGVFTNAGGVSANRIACWDGNTWSPLGLGMNGVVSALTICGNGSENGPALFAGGSFTSAGGASANRVARWDGNTWKPLGAGMNNTVSALTFFDDGSGSGPTLYAGGNFTSSGDVTAKYFARWDGESWSSIGSGMNDRVEALMVFDDGIGEGPALYLGGRFTTADGVTVSRIACWNGSAWSPIGAGISGSIRALTAFGDSSQNESRLISAGDFTIDNNELTSRIAQWDGNSWNALVSGAGMNKWPYALAVYDDGSGGGPALYAGGEFTNAGGMPVNHIARWDGESWNSLGLGTNNTVWALAVHDDGSGHGPALYVAGDFTIAGDVQAHRVARWDGTSWSPLGTGMNNTIFNLAVHDDGSGNGPALYAGGWFERADGVTVNRIARWDGSTWSPLGSGMNDGVWALTVFDDGSGSGPALYAGGDFTSAGGVPASRIARWDGSSWTPLGSGMNERVHALTVFDDGTGSGARLYAGGIFTSAGGVTTNRVARWDGHSWGPVGTGVSSTVWTLNVYDDESGDGPALYAGGRFTVAGGAETSRIARWNGVSWTPLGLGMSGGFVWVFAMTAFEDGTGGPPGLYVGGNFTSAGGNASAFIAKWQPCPDIAPAPCPGDITGNGTVGLDDFAILAANFGAGPGATLAQGDLNGDGFVNLADFNILALNFGADCN